MCMLCDNYKEFSKSSHQMYPEGLSLSQKIVELKFLKLRRLVYI